MKSYITDIEQAKRPFLEEFLTTIYKKYDIAVWSQTSWKWLEMKLTELGMLTSENYKISFVLDRTLMIPVTTKTNEGKIHTHEVKALEIIWKTVGIKYGWNTKNTIHVSLLLMGFYIYSVLSISLLSI